MADPLWPAIPYALAVLYDTQVVNFRLTIRGRQPKVDA